MARAFDVVLLDLGHTLYYYAGDWSASLAQANAVLVQRLLQAGYRLDAADFTARFAERLAAYHSERETEFFELSTETILRTLLAEAGYPNPPAAGLRAALDAMYAVTQGNWQPEDDARPTLETLRAQGYRLGIISNAKDERDVEIILQRGGLREFFDHVLTSTTIGRRKPHPHIFEVALQRFDVPVERAVMVGDTLGADILGAQGVGMCSVWITRRSFAPGNRDHAATIFPHAAISALRELPALLEAWSARPGGCSGESGRA